jgi:hypothetical protein
MTEYDASEHDALEQRQPAADPEQPVPGGGTEPDLEASPDDVAEQRESLHGSEHGGPAERSVELDPADAADEPIGDDEDEEDYR